MVTKKKVAPALPGSVVYYNRWTCFENKEIGDLFECIPYEDAVKLVRDATIWIDVEQPSGKVYGFDRAQIISVKNHDDRVNISYKGPHIQGSITVHKKDGWHKVHRCTDDARLVRLIESSPLAIETGTVGSVSEAARKYLGSMGAAIVPA